MANLLEARDVCPAATFNTVRRPRANSHGPVQASLLNPALLSTGAEELGLDEWFLFFNHHKWHKEDLPYRWGDCIK